MPDNLKQKTISGVSWSFTEQILSRGINFAIGIILAMKMDSDQATEVSTSAVEACKEIGIHTIAE